MLGMIISFIIGLLAGITLMCIYQVETINEYEKIVDDMAEQLVDVSMWDDDGNIVILNTKEKVKEFFIERGENKWKKKMEI